MRQARSKARHAGPVGRVPAVCTGTSAAITQLVRADRRTVVPNTYCGVIYPAPLMASLLLVAESNAESRHVEAAHAEEPSSAC
jgi:hypothetical protein